MIFSWVSCYLLEKKGKQSALLVYFSDKQHTPFLYQQITTGQSIVGSMLWIMGTSVDISKRWVAQTETTMGELLTVVKMYEVLE